MKNVGLSLSFCSQQIGKMYYGVDMYHSNELHGLIFYLFSRNDNADICNNAANCECVCLCVIGRGVCARLHVSMRMCVCVCACM